MREDALEFLAAEHRQVEGYFDRLRVEPTDRETLRAVISALVGHDAVERKLLYPLVAEKVAGLGSGLAEHALDAHEEVSSLLVEIEKMVDKDDLGEVAEPVARLMTAVSSHVAEEEQQLFPRLRQVTSVVDLRELGTKMRTAREKAPTHPHSLMPRSPLGAKLAGTAAALVDRVKDAVQH